MNKATLFGGALFTAGLAVGAVTQPASASPPGASVQCELVRLEASDAAYGDHFGSVAIQGGRIVVGASMRNFRNGYTGAVYVFRGLGLWSEEAILEAADGAPGDLFGEQVAISHDRIVVGVRFDESGSAYVFHFDGVSWSQEAKLTAADGAGGDWFGDAVAIDGDVIVIGARGDDGSKGSAYVFRRNGVWKQEQKLVPSDHMSNHIFGSSVAVRGNTIAVGALGDDDQGVNAGAVYMFEFNGDAWVQDAKLTSRDLNTLDWLGSSVAIDEIGDRIVSGAEGGDAAYVFSRTGGSWRSVYEAKLTPSDGNGNDDFGTSVAISGSTIVVGAPFEGPGASYVYQQQGENWSETFKLEASDEAGGDEYGFTVSIDGKLVVVGAPLHPSEFGPGHAYVYGLNDTVCCPWDLDADGNVGTGDLIVLLGAWGNPYNTGDLIELLGNWGPCS